MQVEDIRWFCEVFFGRRPPEGTLSVGPMKVEKNRFEQLLVKKGGGEPEPIEVIESDREEWKRLQL